MSNEVTKAQLIKSLAILAKYCTTGKTRYTSTNPWLKPEIRQALQVLAQTQGIKDYLDVDLKTIIKDAFFHKV